MRDSDGLACLRSKLVGILLIELGAETNLDRIVVGGTERVAVAVNRVVAIAEEVLGVVVAAGVFERNRLVAVDVPHCRVLYKSHRSFVGEHVVQGTELAVELVGLLGEILLVVNERVAATAQRVQRVFHGVGVEVADEEGRQLLPVVLLVHVVEQCLRLRNADIGVVALAVAGGFVAIGHGALGLEVVDHGDEVFVVVTVDGIEFLRQRLACHAGEGRVVEDAGLADRLDLRGLVDEADADEVFGGAECARRFHVVPLVLAGGFIELVDQVGQCVVALRNIAGDAGTVFNLGQAENVCVELVNRGDDLRLLILERILAVRAAHVAEVSADLGAVLVGVRLASRLVLAQGGEVVQHVEEADGVVTLDGVRNVVRRCAGIFPGDRQFLGGVLAGDRLQRLEAPLVERVVDHNIGLEGHLVAGADRLHTLVGSDQVRKRSFFVGAEVVAGATVVEIHNLGCLLRVDLGNLGLVGNDHVGRIAERLIARRQAEIAGVVQGVVVGHRVRP